MGIRLADLIKMSPCLYHATYEDSLRRILRLRRLECSASLMEAGGQRNLLRLRRDAMAEFCVDGEPIVLTDQGPINEKNIAFQAGWTLPDLIEALNQRVFFWRGTEQGLLKSNQGHFEKYEEAEHRLAFLRLNFEETNRLNTGRGPELCKHNSGAARQYNGKPIPRGPKTFVRPEEAEFMKCDVQEVVFRAFVDVPSTTEVCYGSWKGPWQPLFEDCHEN